MKKSRPATSTTDHFADRLARLLILSAALILLIAVLHRNWARLESSFTAEAGTAINSLPDYDQEALNFATNTKLLTIARECVPIHVTARAQINVQYLYCPPDVQQQDGKAYQISDKTTVPEVLARRFNFWRRVYSFWSKDQYVLHAGEFPEVIFEILETSRLGSAMAERQKEKTLKPIREERKRDYRTMLLTLDRHRNTPIENLPPSLQRLALAMAHIQRADKYALAASSLRVQRGQREFIERGLKIAPRYMPHIESEFVKQGVPPEYARLAFIESSFNLQACSKVGASGVFQIMPQTGRDYLIVSGEIDERNDPVKASRAAAKLLLLNYRLLGKWPLAITAYNHGVGGIKRAMQATRSSDITVLIQRYDGPNFGFASKNFYTGYLGLLATLKDAPRLFPQLQEVQPLNYVTVRVGGDALAEVKKRYRLSIGTIADYNPDITWRFLRRGGFFPAQYNLKIPAATSLAAVDERQLKRLKGRP